MLATATSDRMPLRGWPGDHWPPRPAAADPERAVVAALRAGDEAAFAALVRRHHRAMVHVARGFVATDAVAEEVVQETWLAVVGELDRFEHRSSLKTWIFSILVRRAQTRGAREHRVIPFAALRTGDEDGDLDASAFRDGAWATPPRPWHEPERRLESLEARDALRAALASLPARQRAVVTLRDVEGLDASEVASLLGISPGNQRVLLHRGRAKLRDALSAVLG